MKSLLVCLTVVWFTTAVPSVACGEDAASPIDKLFDPLHVVDVRIEMKEQDWDRVRLQSRSLFEALQNEAPAGSPFKYAKADVTIDGVRIEDVGIRKKGFLGSLDDHRPSLKIRFDKYVNQQPYGALDRLTLNNNKQDPSCLSQFLSYKLFNESGTVASRCGFAKVTVNDEYLGIYSNVEPMEPPLLERGYGDGSGMLFEGTVVDLLGGSVHKFEPKTEESELAGLRAITAALEDEELDLDKLETLLDIEAFVRFWAMESLIGFWDGYAHNQNNFFVYQNPANSKHYFLPWGADSAFTYDIPPQIDRVRHRSFHHQSVLANRFYHNSTTRKLYRATLDKLLATCWNEETLLAEVDRVEALLKNDIRDSNSAFPGAVAKVRSFIKGRRRVLERELKRWPIELTVGPRQPAYAKEIGHGRASFTTEWYPQSPSKPETRGSVEIDLTLNGEPVTFRQIGATAEPSKDLNFAFRAGPKPPTLVLTGLRESDGRRLTLAMGLGIKSFRPTQEPVGMIGVLIDGNVLGFLAQLMFNPSSITLIDAQATFDEASMESGSPVQGQVQFKIMKFAGGKAPKADWKTPPRAPEDGP